MIIEEARDGYAIRDTSTQVTTSHFELKWRYKAGTHFLMVLTEMGKEQTLEEVVEILEKNEIEDSDILGCQTHRVFTSRDETMKVFFLREQRFAKEGRCWKIPQGEIRKKIPYRIMIFVCEKEEGNPVLHVYDCEDPDQITAYLPQQLVVTMKQKTKGFLIGTQTYTVMRVQTSEFYEDGAIGYQINKTMVPLPKTAMGKDLVVKMKSPDDRIHFYVDPRMKQYYEIKEKTER